MPTEEMTQAALKKLDPGLTPQDLETAKIQIKEEMASRVRRQNQWACELGTRYNRLVPLIGIQKILGVDGMVEEVIRGHAQGARGVKMVPGMNRFLPDDRDLWPMYEKCQELGMPVTSDTGSIGPLTPKGRNYGEPANFTSVLESFPRLTLVMCHLASAFWDERVEMASRYPNLCFDMSGGFNAPDFAARDGRRAIAEEDAVRIMRKVGIDRIIFGTDGPGVMPQPCIEQIMRLSLTEEEKRMILAENAKRIYKI